MRKMFRFADGSAVAPETVKHAHVLDDSQYGARLVYEAGESGRGIYLVRCSNVDGMRDRPRDELVREFGRILGVS